jgi:hypothetical protein
MSPIDVHDSNFTLAVAMVSDLRKGRRQAPEIRV